MEARFVTRCLYLTPRRRPPRGVFVFLWMGLSIINGRRATVKSKFLFLLFALLMSSAAQATVWQVYVGSNFFAPESLVVELGDTGMFGFRYADAQFRGVLAYYI